MKTALRLLSAFALIVSFLMISCSKEINEQQAGQKTSFVSHSTNKPFTANNMSMLHQITAMAKKLNFAETPQSSHFSSYTPSPSFTGGSNGSSPSPDFQGGYMVSSFGFPDQFRFVFNYDAERIKYINVFDYGDEMRIFFTYNSQGRIIKTEVYDVYDGTAELSSYDVFTYNTQGRVVQVYENIGNYEAYFAVSYEGQTVKYTTDFYDTEMIYQYSNGNVVKETINITYGDVYTETTTYQFDNKSNFWKPLNIPQPFFSFYGWMESVNNMTKQTNTDFEGYSYSTYFWYNYNSEGYPTYMYSDDDDLGPINYINCGK